MRTKIILNAASELVGSIPLLVALLLSSCSKEKTDVRREDPYNKNIVSSQTRVVLVNGMDIMVNGKKLSNWLAGSSVGGGPETPPNPTPYFPTTGKPGNTYFIPSEFIDADGHAEVQLFRAGADLPIAGVKVTNDYTNPLDYYYHLDYATGSALLTPIPRPVIKPLQPQNILVRVVNLASDDVAGSDAEEKLSLAYADGSRVSNATSGISKEHWSAYTEIPYGTYEFRMLIDGTTKQYPHTSSLNIHGASDFRIANTLRYYTQRRVFQPGGVYTIVVSLKIGKDPYGVGYPVNMFSVIEDLPPQVNLSYARVQIANGLSDDALSVQLDDHPVPAISFGKASDYIILTNGEHSIRWGSLNKEQHITVKGGDNFTVVAYPGSGNQIATMVWQNNMSGVINNSSSEDGSDGITAIYDPVSEMAMNIQTRFMNLCPELPYVTFTAKNGASLAAGTTAYPDATVNLPYGSAPASKTLPYPYINLNNTVIEAYASKPGAVPGNRLYGVTPLAAADFIHLPDEFYPDGLPAGEAGVYTVMLVGHYTNERLPALVVIKHNK